MEVRTWAQPVQRWRCDPVSWHTKLAAECQEPTIVLKKKKMQLIATGWNSWDLDKLQVQGEKFTECSARWDGQGATSGADTDGPGVKPLPFLGQRVFGRGKCWCFHVLSWHSMIISYICVRCFKMQFLWLIWCLYFHCFVHSNLWQNWTKWVTKYSPVRLLSSRI